MVLYEEESEKYFAEDLLTFMREKKNDDVRRILEKYQPSEESLTISRLKDSSESTLLHYAAEYGNEEIVKHLIDLGSEIDALDKLGRSPLILALIGQHLMAIDVLIQAEADFKLTNVDGKSACHMILELGEEFSNVFLEGFKKREFTLIEVVCFGNAKLIKWFLDRGSAVNETDAENGRTALHYAVAMNNLEMVKLLIDHGANVDALDRYSSTPLMCMNVDQDSFDSGEYLKILSVLLSRMAFLTESNNRGRMQISSLLVLGCKKVVEEILKWVGNLFVSDELGNTIVHYMACNNNVLLTELLQGRNFDVKARNNAGLTPLHWAVGAHFPDNVKFLLENGADVHNPEYEGDIRNPLHGLFYSLKINSKFDDVKKCIQHLLEYGSDPFIHDLGTIFDKASVKYAEATLLDDQTKEPKTILALMEPIIAIFATKKSLNAQVIELVNTEIQRQPTWVEYFEMCKGQVDRMSKTTISGNVTLFRFLTESNEKITNYARNEELVCKLEKLIEEFESNSPYLDLIRNRLAKAVQAAELKKNAVTAVCWLINLKNNAHYFAAEYIVTYLSNDDMKNLDRVK